MLPICENLRYGIIALLTVALLAGPCRSVVGAFGFSPAHAHASMTHNIPHDAASSHHHAHKAHAQLAQVGDGEAPDKSQHPAPLSCEELCEGWALKKKPRLWAMPVPDDSDEPSLLPRLVSLKIVFLPNLRGWRNQSEIVSCVVQPLSQAAYQLTGRYRL